MTHHSRSGVARAVRAVGAALVVAAVVQELRKPAGERTWEGTLAGFVPYDFRRPTMARLRERMWAPEDPRIITPRAFGVGWTLNAGRVTELVRRQVADMSESRA